MLGDRHQETVCIDLLERSESQGSCGDLSGQSYHGNGVRIGGRDTRDQVGGPGSAGGEAHAGLVLRTCVSVRHVGGTLLVAYQYMPDGRVEKLVVDGDDTSSGISEDGVDTLVLKHTKQCLRTFHCRYLPRRGLSVPILRLVAPVQDGNLILLEYHRAQ